MSIVKGDRDVKDIGSWQQFFTPTCSERVQKAKKRAVRTPEICLEHAYAEMKAYEQYQDETRVVQRARLYETYLKEKTIFILEDELIVGNINSKVRGSHIFGELLASTIERELDDPVKDYAVRPFDRHIISPEERKALREVILPYFKDKNIADYVLERADAETREKAFLLTSSCKHIPIQADVMIESDAGHQMANYEKVLCKGLKGIREEAEWYLARLEEPYAQHSVRERRDFYRAVLISLDAAMAYARRYARLAQEMAAKETDPHRRRELAHISEVCDRVPENPARNWWEALQSVWMMEVLVQCQNYMHANSFGRFDQYMHPFFLKSVIDEKTMSREEALELLECFWVKTSEFTTLVSDEVARGGAGFPMSLNLLLGGQTRSGEDACNEVTMLCMEAEEQVGLIQPEISMRVWNGTPDRYLKKAAELIRLGRGKMKFFSDRKALQMLAKAYPDRPLEDLRDYAVIGCTEITLPHVTMEYCVEAISSAAKFIELVLNNGKCALCGRQIGPLTDDPRGFESMAAVQRAFREQVFYWMEHLVRGVKTVREAQSERLMLPFCSALLEGPLQKGLDMVQGGAWYTSYGVFLTGLADAADSLGVIHKLVYRDKKVTWDQLIKAVNANWDGYENLRQLCINGVPKYGNDNDVADEWASFVMDTWCDSLDWANSQKDLLPYFGGMFIGATMIGVQHVGAGLQVGGLPNGRRYPDPLADTMSAGQGMDRNGPTAVIKSVSKLPTHRLTEGGPINLRLSPQLLANERDLDNFVSFLRTVEELGVYHTQFNVISSALLREAMKKPEKHRDLLVRVASYCSYFVELTEAQQMDIINRTEQQSW